MFAAWMFYWRASRPLGFGMLVVFVAMAWFTRWVYDTFGVWNLLYAAIAVFVVAWIAQFVGHSKLFEGRKPRFFTRSEEHTSELQSLMRISYAVFCLMQTTTPAYTVRTVYLIRMEARTMRLLTFLS